MNQQTKWVAERAVIITLICPRCTSYRENQMLHEVEVQWDERIPVRGISDLVLSLHCRQCSL
jgi:hypothetical protein